MANSNIHWSVAVCLALACSAGSALGQTTATKFSDGKVKILNGEMPESPISKLLGWKYLSFDREARVLKVDMQARSEFLNPVGVIHGGMLAAMLDETLSPTLALTLGPGEFAPTLELKVNFIAPTKPGPVLGTGRIVHRGRSICFMEGQLHDDGGNLLATATATSKITTRPRA